MSDNFGIFVLTKIMLQLTESVQISLIKLGLPSRCSSSNLSDRLIWDVGHGVLEGVERHMDVEDVESVLVGNAVPDYGHCFQVILQIRTFDFCSTLLVEKLENAVGVGEVIF